jgi:hypothetical protein
MFLRNVGWLSTNYMALYPRRQYSLEKIPFVISPIFNYSRFRHYIPVLSLPQNVAIEQLRTEATIFLYSLASVTPWWHSYAGSQLLAHLLHFKDQWSYTQGFWVLDFHEILIFWRKTIIETGSVYVITWRYGEGPPPLGPTGRSDLSLGQGRNQTQFPKRCSHSE